jgi:hypothetical protein
MNRNMNEHTQMKNRNSLIHTVLTVFAFCASIAAATYAGAAEPLPAAIKAGNAELTVVLGANPSPAEMRVKELLVERLKERSGIALAGSSDQALFRLVIWTTASNKKIKAFSAPHKEVAALVPDGYCIVVDTQKKEVYVAGQSDSGVVAGVGRLMREIRYLNGKIEVPSLNIAETPQMPNRGMYLWARKYYFNQPDQVDRYIEEFALWGGNAICFWFEMGMFENFQDTKGEKSELNSGYARQYKLDKSIARDWIAMYQRFYATARRMGMKPGTFHCAKPMTLPEGWIEFIDRNICGSGHGWAVAWNCTAKLFNIQQPPGAMNRCIGGVGELDKKASTQGPWLSSHGKPVLPESLYLAQLRERLGESAVKNIGY